MLTLSELPLREARIRTDAIRANAAVLVARAGSRPILADVAADGYGHGAVESAHAAIAGGALWLGVSDVADAVELRKAGIRNPVTALYGDAALARRHDVVIGPVPDVVNAGAALYGLVDDGDLVSAMRVSARVVGTKTIAAGEGVSYGHTFRAAVPTNLALVAIGYADGLDRPASNLGTLRLAGKPRLIAGRVAMNVLMLDLGDDMVTVGGEAVVFGDASVGEPSAVEWAARLRKSAAEVATVLGNNLPRSHS